jgi:hypothetical protein
MTPTNGAVNNKYGTLVPITEGNPGTTIPNPQPADQAPAGELDG